jgi:oligopeptide/dipeptide ABC transporter ATP-binding protein
VTTTEPQTGAAVTGTQPVLSIRNLHTEFRTPDGIVKAVDGVSYDLYPGETLGVVGESGSGKSVTVMSILGLIPQPPGDITEGEILFQGRDLLKLRRKELRKIRGKEIAMIFQDPMTSLNPVLKVGFQLAEAIKSHNDSLDDDEVRNKVIQLLELVGIPDPEVRADQHPHEYSGGMRQRAMIAMAMANEPKVLIADEPTTALDVTIQAQVLEVLEAAQDETQAGTILITHDLGLIAEMADRVVVMYAGRVVEVGDVFTIFHEPRHPYTLGLMASLPRLDAERERLAPIPGQPPSLIDIPPGCAFHPRCRLRQGRERCRTETPPLYEVGTEHRSACHFYDEVPALREEMTSEIGGDPAAAAGA